MLRVNEVLHPNLFVHPRQWFVSLDDVFFGYQM
jgi:hypothetical protein